jgi:hypothetical protein
LQNFDTGRRAILFRHNIQEGQQVISEAATAEFNELLNMVVQADFLPIPPQDLPDMTPADMMKVMWMICSD